MLNQQKDIHVSILVWIKITNLPLEFWNEKCFSYMGSVLGNSLAVDMQTEKMEWISYAQLCVDIQATSAFSKTLSLSCNEESITVGIEYQWLPPVCAKCQVYGHKCSAPTEAPKEASPAMLKNSSSWNQVGKGHRIIDTLEALTIDIGQPRPASPPKQAQSAVACSTSRFEALANLDRVEELALTKAPTSSGQAQEGTQQEISRASMTPTTRSMGKTKAGPKAKETANPESEDKQMSSSSSSSSASSADLSPPRTATKKAIPSKPNQKQEAGQTSKARRRRR